MSLPLINGSRPMPPRLVRRMKKLAAQHPDLAPWELRQLVETSVDHGPFDLRWLLPSTWLHYLLGWVGGESANLILTFPLWCLAGIGLFWGFCFVIMGVQILNGGVAGAIHHQSFLFVAQGTPIARALEGRLTGQADRNAWADLLNSLGYISGYFALWGAFKLAWRGGHE